MFSLRNQAPAFSRDSSADCAASDGDEKSVALTTWHWRLRESSRTRTSFWMLVAAMASSHITLAGLLGSYVLGIDVDRQPEALISFRRYDGKHFPAGDHSFVAIRFCYVLHHTQDLNAIFSEVKRVLRDDGLVVVYEDIPATWCDRILCSVHNRQWRGRTGECTFRTEAEWLATFQAAGFEIIQQRTLSRWRNFAHPVRRKFFLLRRNPNATESN